MRAWSLAFAGLLVVGSAWSRTGAEQVAGKHVVTIENMEFNPHTLAVRVGDRIVWFNKDPFPHTATAIAAGFDSGTIGPNASWTYVVTRPGNFSYTCTFHPTMKGVVTITK